MKVKKSVTTLEMMARVLRTAETRPRRSRSWGNKLMRRAMKRYAGAVVDAPPMSERRKVAERRLRARVRKTRRHLKASGQTFGAAAALRFELQHRQRVRKQRLAIKGYSETSEITTRCPRESQVLNLARLDFPGAVSLRGYRERTQVQVERVGERFHVRN